MGLLIFSVFFLFLFVCAGMCVVCMSCDHKREQMCVHVCAWESEGLKVRLGIILHFSTSFCEAGSLIQTRSSQYGYLLGIPCILRVEGTGQAAMAT